MTRAGGLLVLICPGPGRCSAAARHSLGHPRAARHPGVNLAPWLFPSGYPQGHGAPGVVDSRCSLGPASELWPVTPGRKCRGSSGPPPRQVSRAPHSVSL